MAIHPDLPVAPAGSEPYDSDNLLDRVSRRTTLELYYRHQHEREAALVAGRVPPGGVVLSVGCGWHPGRHLFPAPRYRLVAVDANPAIIAGVGEGGSADEAFVGRAGALTLEPRSFDVVLYRLVLHHVAYREPLRPIIHEAARLLRPGGTLIAIEPGLWHPVGAGLALANRLHLATALHGTPDDVPLSPRRLVADARSVGLIAELHAVTYGWRRLAPPLQRMIELVDRLGSRPRAAMVGHTVVLIARRPR